MMSKLKKMLRRTPKTKMFEIPAEPDKIQYTIAFDEKEGVARLQILGDAKVPTHVLALSLGLVRDNVIAREAVARYQHTAEQVDEKDE